MVYLELKDEKSSKFWQIAYTDKCYTVVYGKIGAKGSVKVTTCDNPEEEALALIKSKKKKGYIEAVEDLSPYLVFDNINFKIAILNSIKYHIEDELEELLDEYYDEHMDTEYDFDDDNIDDIYGINYKAVEYVKYCKIPKKFALGLEKVSLEGGDEVLEQINLEWGGETEYFDINELSDRELAQFPDLKKIYVLYTYGMADDVKEQCKKIGIEFKNPYE